MKSEQAPVCTNAIYHGARLRIIAKIVKAFIFKKKKEEQVTINWLLFGFV